MRLPFRFVVPLVFVACGGSTIGPTSDDERVPATPLPSEQIAAPSTGPTGFVTVLSIDGYAVALPSFHEDASRTREASATPCNSSRAANGSRTEVSAGMLTFTVPTRDEDRDFAVFFDPKKGSYEPASFEALVEPGGILRISAKGDSAPAFDAELKTAANVAFDVAESIELDANAPKDLVIGWNAEGDNDEVFLDLGIGDTSVTCWFDSSAGTGTVPAALVAELVKEDVACERPTCLMFLASKRTKDVAVGDWTMVLSHGFATIKDVRVTR